MLVKINPYKAFNNLMDENNAEKIYCKVGSEYKRTIDHKWHFSHSGNYSGLINFITTEFYLEVEEEV